MRAEGVFVGYKPPTGSQQHIVVVKGKVYASCNVTFDERCVTLLAARASVSLDRSVLKALPTTNLRLAGCSAYKVELQNGGVSCRL